MTTEILTQLKQNKTLIDEGLDADTLAVATNNLSGSMKRISIRGGVFRKIVNGEEVAVLESPQMNVVIAKMSHTAARTFYAEAYKEGERISPTCWSSDSKIPDHDVPTKQASICSECPHSIKGASTKCRLSWRTAVILPEDLGGEVLQLILPATSTFGKEDIGRWPFKAYVQMLASNNISASRVITRMEFDTSSSLPRVLFSPRGIVDSSDIPTVKVQNKSKAAEQAIALTVYQTDSPVTPMENPFINTKEPIKSLTTGDVLEVIEENVPPKTTKHHDDLTDIISRWSTKN